MPERLNNDEIRHALKYVSDYSRNNWVRVGMALKLDGYPFEIWREWSEADPGHVWKDREGMQQWQSFKKDSGNVVTLGTVIMQAEQNGWKRTGAPSAEKLPELIYQDMEELGEPEGTETPAIDISEQAEKAYQDLKADPEAIKHFTARGLTEQTIDMFRLGYLPAGMKEAFSGIKQYTGNPYAFVYKYVFPFLALNGCNYAVFENESRDPRILEKAKKYMVPSDFSKPLYNENIFETDRKPETVFVTEGVYDCLSIEQCGARAVALCGTAAAPLIRTLTRLNVPKETRFIIALDNDQAGTEASPKLAERLKAAGYDSIRYAFQGTKADGSPIKDANELLIANPAELARQIAEAEQLARGIEAEPEYIPKLPPDMPYEYLLSPPPLKRPVISGFLREGEALLLSGQSKAGKTFLAYQLAHAVATGGNWIGQKCNQKSVLYIDAELSQEMTAHRFRKIREKMGIPVPPENLQVKNIKGTKIKLRDIADDITHGFNKRDLIIIDPLYLVTSSEENDNSQMKEEMYTIAEMCAAGCSVVVVHHMAKGVQSGKFSIDRAAGAGVVGRFFDSIVTVNVLESETGDQGKPERIEADTRSFPQPVPIQLWLDDGFHVVDSSGELSFRSLANPQKKNAEKKNDEDVAKINHCYHWMMEKGKLDKLNRLTVKGLIEAYEQCYGKTLSDTTARRHLTNAGYSSETESVTVMTEAGKRTTRISFYAPDGSVISNEPPAEK